jgi:hypothetical protein
LDERVSTTFSTIEEADSYIVREAQNLKVSVTGNAIISTGGWAFSGFIDTIIVQTFLHP